MIKEQEIATKNFDVQSFYTESMQGDIVFAYRGSVSSDFITESLQQVEDELIRVNESSKIRKKLYRVLVEALQNLYHHTGKIPQQEEKNLDQGFALIVLSILAEGYKILTGNFVENVQMKILKDRLNQINFLSSEELKKLYKIILNNEEFSQKGGGGLGMIDMARRTQNKLEYEFYQYNKEFYFYSLKVTVN